MLNCLYCVYMRPEAARRGRNTFNAGPGCVRSRVPASHSAVVLDLLQPFLEAFAMAFSLGMGTGMRARSHRWRSFYLDDPAGQCFCWNLEIVRHLVHQYVVDPPRTASL